MNKTNLQELVWAVTYRCNSRCRMCNIWKIDEHSHDLDATDLKKFPKTVSDLNISGGEPFLRSDLAGLIKKLKENNPGLRIIISTNGFASQLIEDRMKEILAVDPDVSLAFSLDGVGETHNNVRNIPEGYAMVLESIRRCRELGVKSIRIGFTMGDYNTSELREVYALSKEMGLEMSLAVVHSSENFFNAQNTLDKKTEMIEELDWLIDQELSTWKPKNWARAYFAHGMKYYLETGKRLLPDYSGQANLFMDPRGDIYPCDVSSERLGNIKSDSFAEMMREPKDRTCRESWMICTARPAIKKHLFRVLVWMGLNKIRNIFS